MTRCDSCGEGVTSVDENGDGLKCGCARTNPLERAAVANFAKGNWDTWMRVGEFARELSREKARRILTAAINVTELAAHIGPDHARLVRDHLLGSAHD